MKLFCAVFQIRAAACRDDFSVPVVIFAIRRLATATLNGWNDRSYNGLAAFVRATKNDLNSQFANPDFLNASTGDFHLSSSPPALKAPNSVLS